MFLVKLGNAVKVEGSRRPPPGKAGQHRGKLIAQQGLHGVDKAVAVGLGQQHQGVNIPPGGVLQGGVGPALVHQMGVGALVVPQPVPQPVPQALIALFAQVVKQLGVVLQGLPAFFVVQVVQQIAGIPSNRCPHQFLVGGQPQQGCP